MSQNISRDKPIYIVGKKIKQQLGLPNIINYDEFIDLLEMVDVNDIHEFRIGQGLSSGQVNSIFLLLKNYIGCVKKYNIKPQICNKAVHKLDIKNTMISIPEKIDESNYKSYLFVDEECAEMSDHMTGCHIQGLVLVEAARQMVNAVADKYYINDNSVNFFVLNELNATFRQYSFPLDIELHYKIINLKKGLNGNFASEVEINFVQNNNITTTVSIKYQAMNSKIMSNYEKSLAQKCIKINSLRI